jgi:hypothetical protein
LQTNINYFCTVKLGEAAFKVSLLQGGIARVLAYLALVHLLCFLLGLIFLVSAEVCRREGGAAAMFQFRVERHFLGTVCFLILYHHRLVEI